MNLNESYSNVVIPKKWKDDELNNGTYRFNFIFNSTQMQDDSDMNITLKGLNDSTTILEVYLTKGLLYLRS